MTQKITALRLKLASIEPDIYIAQKIKSAPANVKLTFVFSLILVFLVHGFGFFNKFLNEDSLFYFYTSMMYMYNLGRWMLVFLQHIRGFYTAPWIIGVFAALYLAVANALIISVLEIKNKISCVIISLLIVAFPAWANQFMYDFMADAYPAAMFLAVLAIYLCKKMKFGFIFGAFSLMLSLALYQSFLAFAVGLSLMVIIRYVLENTKKLSEIGSYIARFLFCGILGMVLYLISVRISLLITGGQLSGYQGADYLGRISLRDFPTQIILTYSNFLRGFYVTGPTVNQLYVSTGLFYLYGMVFLLIVYMLVRIAFNGKMRKLYTYAILAGCLLLLPIGLNITEMIAPMALTHILMTNAFVLSVVLIFVLLEVYGDKASFYLKCFVILITMLIGGNYWRQSSSFYFVQHIQYERTSAFYNRLLLRIEGAEGYEPGMPVAVVGTAPFPYIGASDVMSAELWQIVGFSGHRPAMGLGEPQKIANFMRNFLGVNINFASHAQTERVMATAEFLQMPLYPRYGSVMVVDDVLVVRLNAVYEHDINIAIDGRDVVFPAQRPFRLDTRVIAPAREVFEALGYTMGWDGSINAVTIAGDDRAVSITIGENEFITNDTSHTFDFPAQIMGDSAMVPIVVLLESMGYCVGWDGVTQTVYVRGRND